MTALIVMAVALIALLFCPFQSQKIAGRVAPNETGCDISVANYSGWRDVPFRAGLWRSEVVLPLEVVVFVVECTGLPGGQPYAAVLASASTGQPLVRSRSCGDAPDPQMLCRLEVPAAATPAGDERFVVLVTRRPGEAPRRADVRLAIKREWRSLVYDALMSV